MSSYSERNPSAASTTVKLSTCSTTPYSPSPRLASHEQDISRYSAKEAADFLPKLFESYEDYQLTNQNIEDAVIYLQGKGIIEISSGHVNWKDPLATPSGNEGLDAQICQRFDMIRRAITPGGVRRHFVFLDRGTPQALPGSNEEFESSVIPDLALVPTHVPLGDPGDSLLIPPTYRNWTNFDLILETKRNDKAKCLRHAKHQLLALMGAQPHRIFALGLAYYSTMLKVIRLDQCGFVESTAIDVSKLDGLKDTIQLIAWITTTPPEALGVIPGAELKWLEGPMRLSMTSSRTIQASTRFQNFRQLKRLVIDPSFFPGLSSSVSLLIVNIVVNRCSAQGRGTRAWKVMAENHPLSSMSLILKLSFQPAFFNEGNPLPTNETKFHQDFPAAHWWQSSILTAEARMASDAKDSILSIRGLQRPRNFPFNDRVMAINVIREANSLSKIEDPVLLLRALVDIIEAVQELYNQGYLHRDLSPSNVGLIHVGKRFRGVIYDLDMTISASYLKERHDSAQVSKLVKKHTRTGTLPFMALGILDSLPDRHDLCHDLESIVWIFIVTLAHDSQSDQPYPSMIAEMMKAERREICHFYKKDIITAAETRQLVDLMSEKLVKNPQHKEILESLIHDVFDETIHVINKAPRTNLKTCPVVLIRLFKQAADKLEQQQQRRAEKRTEKKRRNTNDNSNNNNNNNNAEKKQKEAGPREG